MISLDNLIQYLKVGLIPIPLNDLSSHPTILWGEIYNNPNFWSIEKLTSQADKFYNVATTFGETPLRDLHERKLFLYCLDIDSQEVLKRVTALLEEWKLKTFVTKTQKDCGYHIYWFENSDGKSGIVTEDCRKGFEFEIKCGKSLCTLPPSRHRDNPFFHYENVGRSDKIMIADGLYDKLVNDLLANCLKKSRRVLKPKGINQLRGECTDTPSQEMSENKDVDASHDKLDQLKESHVITKKVILTNKQIEKSTEYLLPYYKEGIRNKFAFGFSGLALKEGIAQESAIKILENICKIRKDPELNSRLDTLHRTYINGSENGSESITGKSKLKEVIMYVSDCDDTAAEDVIQRLLYIWHIKEDKHDNDDRDSVSENNNTYKSQAKYLKKELITARIHSPAEYAINVINKTVKLDDSLVRGVFYTGCSTWISDPINLGIIAPTSEGKTYTVLQVLQYFPRRDVKYIGSMSPKVIIRQDSILVDADTLKPIQADIDVLRKEIKKEKDEKRKDELKEQLQNLKDNARPLIDLRNKIYVFLEPPRPELWNIIKPIMSHDNFVIEHPYVESNNFQGIHVRSIITQGFPAFIFCTAKDESKWEQWDEIASRSQVMSPNMSTKKYRAANILNACQLGLPTAMQEILIRSTKEADLARKCILYIKNTITQSAIIQPSSEIEGDFHHNNPVWIPYQEILGNTLPADKGTEMRINRRLILLLRIISLAKSESRYQVVFNNQTLTIAAVVDLSEALYIMQNSTGLPPYKIKFFNEIFYPLCQQKLEEKLRDYHSQENAVIKVEANSIVNKVTSASSIPTISSVRLTTNEICDYYNRLNPKSPINSDNLRKTYLNELTFAGFVEALDIREGNTKKVYYPIVSQSEVVKQKLTQETGGFDLIPQSFTHHKINIPTYFTPFSENWLNLQVLALWKCGINIRNVHINSSSLTWYNDNNNNSSKEKAETPIVAAIQFLGEEKKVEVIVNDGNTFNSYYNNREKITMTEFVRKYTGSSDNLSQHFSRPIFANSYNKIFGKLKYLGIISDSEQQTQETLKIPEFPQKPAISDLSQNEPNY